MRYRTGFVTNSSSVCFYIGKKGESKRHVDDAFRIWRDCWNEYYDAIEKVFAYLLDSDDLKHTVLIGTYEEIRYALIGRTDASSQDDEKERIHAFLKSSCLSDQMRKQLKQQFGIDIYDIEEYVLYDPEKRKVIREPWLKAETYKEAVKRGFTDIFVHFFDLSDELMIKWKELCRMEQDGRRGSEEYRKQQKECILLQKLAAQDNPALSFACYESVWRRLSYFERTNRAKKDSIGDCQIAVDAEDDSGMIPDFVYHKMEEQSAFTVFDNGNLPL